MSERRRQRQQRVRHEAGDFQPLNVTEEAQISKQDSVGASKEKTESNNTNAPQSIGSSVGPQQKADDRGQRFRDDRRNAKGRGRGKSRQDAPQTQRNFDNRTSNTNVAVAEEREYEPVMIMESRTDGPGGSGSAKLVSPFVPSISEPIKYRRGQVENNWLPYNELPPEEVPEEGEDYLLGEDFQQIIDSNATKGKGGFLHLKEEMSWGKVDESQFGDFGLGALKVSDLVAALQTIPLFEQLQMPEDELPPSYIAKMKQDAERARKAYQPNKEYKDETELNKQILEKLRISENEPLKLSSEGPNSSAASGDQNSNSATQKFASAFPPGPDDVDLDNLIREGTPEDHSLSSGSVTPLQREAGGTQFNGGDGGDLPEKPGDFVTSGLVNSSDSANSSVLVNHPNLESNELVNPSNPTGSVGSTGPAVSTSEVNHTIPVTLSGPLISGPSVTSSGPLISGPSVESSGPLLSGPSVTSSGPPISTSKDKQAGKPNFDFGLSKVVENIQVTNPVTMATAVEKTTKKKNKKEAKVKEEPKIAEPEIDLDKPTKPKCEAPPSLVTKSEVESLEDWLDSVLDD